MRYKVSFLGALVHMVGCQSVWIDVDESAATALNILDEVEAKFPQIHDQREAVAIVINHEFVPNDYVLSEDDEVVFITRVSGG